ncbi:MAG: extracellular solute-binding protein [Proteobacteria bacterium]|nr:extracellular solute-binding protein [Pseudomonadota bacterium]
MKTVKRRTALKLAGSAAALPLVHIRTAGAAGKLTMVVPDHWVPDGNVAMRKQIEAFAEQNKVEVQADFLTGPTVRQTLSAEALAKTGHDVQVFPLWEVHNNADFLDPVDDVMQGLTRKFGPTNEICEYLGRSDSHWKAVPISTMSLYYCALGRISVLKQAGLDIQAMYPAKPEGSPTAADWNYDTFLKTAEACHKLGMPFGIGLSTTGDCVNWVGQMFRSFGAELIDKNGNVTVNSDAVRQVLEYSKKLVQFLPDNAVAYDDASNNRAYISGKSALVFNPPSPWAVARRDTPALADDTWTFPAPAGPAGRYEAYVTNFWGIWSFAKNKSAAKDFIAYMMQRDKVEERCNATIGYDIPPFGSMVDFPIWDKVGPPPGLCFNYPLRPIHKAHPYIAMSPAPPTIAVKAYNRGTISTMLARLHSGQSIPQVITWAQDELTGFAER